MMAACHLPSRWLTTMWLSVFLLGAATIAENLTEPGVPTEPNQGPSPSWSFTNPVTALIDNSTATVSSLSSVRSATSSTGSVVKTNTFDNYVTTTAVPSSTVSIIGSAVPSLLNPTFVAPTRTQTAVVSSSQTSVFPGVSGQGNTTTSTNGIITKARDLSATSFVQIAASSSSLQTEHVLNETQSSSTFSMKTTNVLTLSSSILLNTTGVAQGFITSTSIPFSSVCIECTTASSSSSVRQNSTAIGIRPSPSLSRTLGVGNETTFATRTLSSNGSSTRMLKITNSSYLSMTSTAGINMTKQTVFVRATSSFRYSSLSQTSSIVERVFPTVYSELMNSTAPSSVVSSTSSVVLSTPTSPPVYAPSAPPQRVEAYNTSSTSIMVTWQPPPSGTLNGLLTKYEVLLQRRTSPSTPATSYSNPVVIVDSTSMAVASSSVRNTVYSITASGTNLSPSTSVHTEPTENPVEPTLPPKALVVPPVNAGLNLSIIVRNLERFTFYEVRVRAVTVRPGPYSSPLTVRTDEDVPNACRNISLSNQNSTSVMVRWTRPFQVNGVLLGYKICYGLNGSIFTTKEFSSDVEAYVLNRLEPFSRYAVKVTAYTRVGEGEAVLMFFNTMEAVPSAVQNLTGTNINSTALRIFWTRPEHPNGVIEYIVMKRIPDEAESFVPVQICQGPETQCVAVGLKPVTRYVFSVYVMNVKHHWKSTVVDVTVVTPQSEPVGPPLDIQAITKNSTSIQVQWQAPAPSLRNGLIKSYFVQYSSEKTSYQSRATQDNTTSLLLTSLTPYTLYYVRVQAVNLAGAGPFSELVINRTFEDAPSPPINITARSVNATCVLVTWGEPDYLNGETVSFVLNHRLTSFNASQNHLTYKGESTMCLVSGLHEYASYTFTLFAYNVNYGYQSASVVAMETTHPAAPSGPPQNSRAITLSSHSILVQWNPPKALDMNGLITEYNVNIKRPDGTNQSRSLNGRNNTLVFKSLHPYTVYLFTVQAVNRVGAGPRSRPVSNRTLEEVPDAPIIDQVTNLSSTVLDVSWLSPRNPNGVVTAYLVCWDLLGQSPRKNCTQTNGTTITFSIVRLVPSSLYNVSIAAATSRGYGPSVSGVFRTMEGVPTKPQNIQAWNTSASSIFVTWTAPVMTNGILTSYNVSYKPSNDSSLPNSFSSGLSTNLTLPNLETFTLYTICVQAATSQGFGAKACEYVNTDEGVPGSIPSFDAQQFTSNSIQLTWRAPSYPNGYVGYILYYYLTINPEWNHTRVFPDGRLQYLVSGLDPYTNYTFSVSAYNLNKGLQGPARLTTATTKTARPSSPPLNVRLVDVTAETITISWDPPAKPNGPIKGYLLMIYDEKTPIDKDVEKVHYTTYTIASLKPWRNYGFQIACIGSGGIGIGPNTKEYVFKTLAAPPKVQPIIPPDKDMITANEISIQLQKASEEYGEISFYQVVVLEIATDDAGKPTPSTKSPDEYKPSELLTYQEAKQRKPDLVPYIAVEFAAKDFDRYRMFKVGDAKNYSIGARKRRDTDAQYYNGPLEPKTYYSMFQRAAVSKDLYSSSSWLEPVSTAESPPAAERTEIVSNTSTGLVIGLCVAFLLIIILIVVVFTILWKKRRFHFGVMLDDESDYTGSRSLKLKKMRGVHRRTSSRGLMGSTDSLDNIDDINRRRQPIPVEEFSNHVRRMHTDGDIGFSEEYELVQPNDEEFTWHHSLHTANKFKNRYANIIAYDHSRVLLSPIEGVPDSDYINANYIDGYNRSGSYIACQGPLPETFDDFWRMIWEQSTATITMLTQLEERGRRKCDQYWPDRGTKNYGAIRVTASETSHMSYYILRTFILSHKQEEEEPRQIKQYHFTSWPDHGVPTHPAPLLSVVRTVSNANPPTAGPILVHCSAGVGRTGTYITLDSMLQKIDKEQTIDVFDFVKQMRTKRNIMVQTEAQYVFIYDALNEAVSCGVTEVDAKRFSGRLRELREVDPNTGRTYIEKEFLRLVKDERHHSTFKNANLGINSSKNRYANILPYEKTRVHLKMRPGEVGSDYVNASYIDGYCRLSAFIATQAPVPHTFEDFWRMIWEQGSSVIMMLTREEEAGKVKCHRYWPSDGTRIFGNVLVELTQEVAYPDYTMRQFNLTHTEEKEVHTVRQYQYTDWPDIGLPESGVGLIDLIGQVEKWQQQSSNSVISVHCSGGVGRTGVFCAVSILIERVKAEGVIDVFQSVQSLRLQRPAMVQTMEQYEFCYSTLQEYLESFDLYANFQ